MTVQDLIDRLQALPITAKHLPAVLPRLKGEWSRMSVEDVFDTTEAGNPIIVIGSPHLDAPRG
jgi:hypothetical protein